MSDAQWIKTLAESRYTGGEWALQDPEAQKLKAQGELADTISLLLQELDEACQVFNLYHKGDREMRTLPLKSGQSGEPYGLILLLGQAQVKLELQGNKLVKTLCQIDQYKIVNRQKHSYLPQFDQFGGLYWQSQGQAYMNRDQLIKALMSDVCQLFYIQKERQDI